jgi:predicted short-subunit dehydrogenase-like oxidoreductase (DUF2520 family)
VLAGTGRAAWSMARALVGAGYAVKAVVSRSPHRGRELARAAESVYLPPGSPLPREATAVVVAQEDDAVASFARQLAEGARPGLTWVHLSGSLPASVLEEAAEAAGGGEVLSFHPLAVLGGREDLRGRLVALEGTPGGVAWGQELARRLWARAVEVPTGAKVGYHLAACLAAGHAVALLHTAQRLLAQAGLEEEAAQAAAQGLLDLAQDALGAMRERGARAAVTGPLVRGDVGTVEAHLRWLGEQGDGEAMAVYAALGLAVLALAGDVAPLREADMRRQLEKALTQAYGNCGHGRSAQKRGRDG